MSQSVDQSCLVFAPAVCVGWDATFQFWETIVATVVAAIVMALTIYFSVKIATEQTEKTLLAALASEARDRIERERLAEAADAVAEGEARRTMASSLVRVAAEFERAFKGEDDAELRRLKGDWAAMAIAFRTSPVEGAEMIYEYADLILEDARTSERPQAIGQKVMHELLVMNVGHRIGEVALEWARDGRLSASSQKTLERLRSESNARQEETSTKVAELLRRIRDINHDPQKEPNIFEEEETEEASEPDTRLP